MGAGSSIAKKSACKESENSVVFIEPAISSSDKESSAQTGTDHISHLQSLQDTLDSDASRASCIRVRNETSTKLRNSVKDSEDCNGKQMRNNDAGSVVNSCSPSKQAEASRASRKIFEFMTRWYKNKGSTTAVIVQTPIQTHTSSSRPRSSVSEMLDSITIDKVCYLQLFTE